MTPLGRQEQHAHLLKASVSSSEASVEQDEELNNYNLNHQVC